MKRATLGRLCVVGLLLLVVAGSIIWALRAPPGDGPDLVVKPPAKLAQDGDEADDFIIVGGIKRRRSDIQAARPLDPDELERLRKRHDYGRLPAVPVDANPQVASVAEALREESHPERVSLLSRPIKFDKEAFDADPAAYLETIEPSRVFQTAQPGPGVPRLRVLGQRRMQLVQGNSVTIRVSAPAGAPVTFTSLDAGAFENQLASTTVQADDRGTAEAVFHATPGTIDNVHILAGSPLAAGQARFVVNVVRPAPADAGEPDDDLAANGS